MNFEGISLHRRGMLKLIGAGVPLSLVAATTKKTVRIVEFDVAGVRTGTADLEKIEKTDAEWKKQLSADQFQIARKAGTEYPGSGKYNKNHEDGLYTCICCNTVLFDSKTKFESGTGWPSFWQPIAKENVTVHRDSSLGTVREEVVCSRCEGHLGHVFDDGPPPTHLRYCMNSASMNFVPRRK